MSIRGIATTKKKVRDVELQGRTGRVGKNVAKSHSLELKTLFINGVRDKQTGKKGLTRYLCRGKELRNPMVEQCGGVQRKTGH